MPGGDFFSGGCASNGAVVLEEASKSPQMAEEGARSHCVASFATTLVHALLNTTWKKVNNPTSTKNLENK